MADLFDDLQDSSSRDYFYALDSAPGGISPPTLRLTVSGLAPTIFEQSTVFRSPAPATLALNGRAPVSDVILTPAPAALSLVGQVPGEYREKIITPAIPDPDYGEVRSIPPTILFISTITPTTGLVQLSSLALNVTPGGNIGFVSPGVGALTLQGLEPTLIHVQPEVGSLSISGLAPTLATERVISPETGSLSLSQLGMSVERPFGWIDVDPPPATSWTTTTGVAA